MSTSTTEASSKERLRALAEAEMTAIRERRHQREVAVLRWEKATKKMAELRQALTECDEECQGAVEDLLDAGMSPNEVSDLVGLDVRWVRAIRAARRPGRDGPAVEGVPTTAAPEAHNGAQG